MTMNAILVDNNRCIGCRACMVACKQWNDRKTSETKFFSGPGYQNPKSLNCDTWTLITYNETFVNGRRNWVFGNLRCMHCQDPACVSCCPGKALEKLPEGPVVYRNIRCLGCRYCMLACPFQIPKFEWDNGLSAQIAKCTMCADRVTNGGIPACVKSCPTQALQFGDRDEMIREAEERIRVNPSHYVHHIYGKDEVGGTCVLHLSQIPFEKIGYKTDLPKDPLPNYTHTAMAAVPPVVVGLALGLSLTYKIIERRQKLAGEADKGKETSSERR
jgi:formate dehydrogenase iron-sulfur subunit